MYTRNACWVLFAAFVAVLPPSAHAEENVAVTLSNFFRGDAKASSENSIPRGGGQLDAEEVRRNVANAFTRSQPAFVASSSSASAAQPKTVIAVARRKITHHVGLLSFDLTDDWYVEQDEGYIKRFRKTGAADNQLLEVKQCRYDVEDSKSDDMLQLGHAIDDGRARTEDFMSTGASWIGVYMNNHQQDFSELHWRGNGRVQHDAFCRIADVVYHLSTSHSDDEDTRYKKKWEFDAIVESRRARHPTFHVDYLPRTGRVTTAYGLTWDGDKDHQCGWAAHEFSKKFYGLTFPSIPYDRYNTGVEIMFRVPTPGFSKVANTGGNLPPTGALMIWHSSRTSKLGHIAVVLGTVNRYSRTVRVIDSNGHSDYRGWIRDVRIGSNIQGWLVPQ